MDFENAINEVIAKYSHTESLDHEKASHLFGLAGRIYAPKVLISLTINRALVSEAYAYLVSYAWTLAEYPGMSLHIGDWKYLFKKAGFTIDGKLGQRPAESIVMYRASWPKYKRNLGWTNDLEKPSGFFMGVIAMISIFIKLLLSLNVCLLISTKQVAVNQNGLWTLMDLGSKKLNYESKRLPRKNQRVQS